MSDPIKTLIPDGVPTPKVDLRTAFARSGHSMTVSDVTGADLTGYSYIFASDLGRFFSYNALSTASHDGSSVLVDDAGNRFLVAYDLPAGGEDGQIVVKDGATDGAVRFDPAPPIGFNLLTDSGRFNGSANQSSLIAASAVAPGHVNAFNSSTLTFPAKFIHNNTTYGGSAGALDSVIDEFIQKIYGPSGLRFGPEFYYMNVALGGGTSSSFTIGADTFYRALQGASNPRPEKWTSGMFVRCSTGKLALRNPASSVNKLTRDGSTATINTSDVVVAPADGVVYFEWQFTRPASSFEQSDMVINLTSGGVGQYALPRSVNGWVDIGGSVGVHPTSTLFPTS